MIGTYLLPVSTAIALADNWTDLTEGQYPLLAEDIGLGKWLAWFMIVGGLVSCMGTYVVYLHTGAVAIRSMADEGIAPFPFSWLRKYKTPLLGLLTFSCTTAVLVLFDFSLLVEVESFLYCVHAALLCSNVFRLRMKEPELKRPFKLPFGRIGALVIPMFPYIVIVSNIISILYFNWLAAAIALSGILLAVSMYFVKEFIIMRYRPFDICYEIL